MTWTEANDGTRKAQGRTGQEGQAQELIYQELAISRGWFAMGDATNDMVGDGVQYANTDEAMSEPPRCTVCYHPQNKHPYRHPFTAPGTRLNVAQLNPQRPNDPAQGHTPTGASQALTGALSVPFDPVLRLALIDAGVITPEQLAAAQAKMQAMNQEVLGHGG